VEETNKKFRISQLDETKPLITENLDIMKSHISKLVNGVITIAVIFVIILACFCFVENRKKLCNPIKRKIKIGKLKTKQRKRINK